MDDKGHASEEFASRIEQFPSTLVEDFLSEFQGGASVNIDELLLIEMRSRLREDSTLDPSEYARRFPELSGEIPSLVSSVMEEFSTVPDRNPRPATGTRGEPTKIQVPSHSAGTAAHSKTNKEVSSRKTGSSNPVEYLGDHKLISVIGRGGMGVVYRALNTKLNREVAVKTITVGNEGNAQALERFRRESEAVARLDHPGIASVYETGEQDGIAWFSMALIRGESLQALLRQGTMVPERAADVLCKLAGAIHYAHQAGVIHRDLKPGNVLLDGVGEPRLVDFGLAWVSDHAALTATGTTMGTPGYMAPEQVSGKGQIGPAADVYGLGAILYACLTGRPPFRGKSTMATLNLVVHTRAVPIRQINPELSRDLETICEKCLEKLPEQRYESADALQRELQRFLEGRPIEARPVSQWSRVRRWCRRNPLVATLITAVFALLVIATGVSSYFAILADEKADSAQIATELANEAASVAKSQSELALRSLRTIIYTVQGQLRDIPEARAVRRELLLVALKDLEAISKSYIEEATVDRHSARALSDLAELYTQLGDDAGGDIRTVASTHFRKAADVYLKLTRESPDDSDLLKDATNLLMDWGDTAREYQLFEEAVEAHQKGRQLAVQWHRDQPDQLAAQYASFRTMEALGEAMLRTGKLKEAREYIDSAAELSDDYCDKVKDADAWDNVNRCYCTKGDMHRMAGEYQAARAAYERMCSATKAMMALDPGDPVWLNDQSADLERLGDLEIACGNHTKAREHFEASLKFSEAYVADDPSNLYRLQESTWAYSKLAKVCRIQGDTERAEWAESVLNQIKQRLRGDR